MLRSLINGALRSGAGAARSSGYGSRGRAGGYTSRGRGTGGSGYTGSGGGGIGGSVARQVLGRLTRGR
jgi:hypothetical protein